MRFQSVLDAFEEDRFFISSRSAKRDEVYALGRFGVNDGNWNTTKKSERDEALLSIGEPVILEGEGRTLEHARRIQEINSMSLQIGPTFPFVSGEAHRRSVYTDIGKVKKPLLLRSNDIHQLRASSHVSCMDCWTKPLRGGEIPHGAPVNSKM